MIWLSFLRGVLFYPLVIALAMGLGWLVLPWRYGESPSSAHMMIAIAGGGAFWILVLVVVAAVALSQLQVP